MTTRDLEAGHHSTKKDTKKDLRTKVLDFYQIEADDLLHGKNFYRKGGEALEGLSKVLGGVASILAFAASSDLSKPATDALAFSSGVVGTVSLVVLTFSTYALKESRQRTVDLNRILDKFQITPLPVGEEETSS
jgi:hypothetical protein